MRNLARVYWYEGKYARSEALNKQALEIERRVLGPEHPQTLNSMNDLAWELVADPDHPRSGRVPQQPLGRRDCRAQPLG